jgi:hypothetical protein
LLTSLNVAFNSSTVVGSRSAGSLVAFAFLGFSAGCAAAMGFVALAALVAGFSAGVVIGSAVWVVILASS